LAESRHVLGEDVAGTNLADGVLDATQHAHGVRAKAHHATAADRDRRGDVAAHRVALAAAERLHHGVEPTDASVGGGALVEDELAAVDDALRLVLATVAGVAT